MAKLLWVVVVGAALILEGTGLNFLRVAGVKPDLLLILTVCHAYLRGPRQGAALGLLSGLAHDLYTGYYLGLNAVAKGAVGLAVGALEGKLYREGPHLAVPVAALATLFHELLFFLGLRYLGVAVPFGFVFVHIVVPACVYNAALTLLGYNPYHRLLQQLDRRRSVVPR